MSDKNKSRFKPIFDRIEESEDEKRVRELQSEINQIERDKRKRRMAENVAKLPDGWEAKLSEAVVEAVRKAESSGSCELIKMQWPDEKRWAYISFHLDVMFHEPTEDDDTPTD